MDTNARPVATSTKDALGVPPSVRPTVDMATCTNGGSGRTSSTYDTGDMIVNATPTTGALDVPSSACTPMDTNTGCASSVNAMAAPTPLTLTTSAAPAGS